MGVRAFKASANSFNLGILARCRKRQWLSKAKTAHCKAGQRFTKSVTTNNFSVLFAIKISTALTLIEIDVQTEHQTRFLAHLNINTTTTTSYNIATTDCQKKKKKNQELKEFPSLEAPQRQKSRRDQPMPRPPVHYLRLEDKAGRRNKPCPALGIILARG